MRMDWVTSEWSERFQGFADLPVFIQLVLLTWAAIVILGGSCFLWRALRGVLAPRYRDDDQKSRRA